MYHYSEFVCLYLAPDPKYIDETVFDDVKARFRREGRRGVNIEHPALLKIHAYVENENGEAFQSGTPKNPFLLMDRSTGGTVEDYIHRLPPGSQNLFTIDETRLRIAIQIAEALQHLHQQELIHRDVKPANVFLSERRLTNPSVIAKLGDFGVMKWGDFHASLSTGTLTATMQEGLGTLKYMSPEQAIHPKEVTSQADIFSFGLTLFELFTGQVLPSPHHVYELMIARTARGTTIGRWLKLGFQLSDTHEGIGQIILDMLLHDPDSRPPIERICGHLNWTYHTIMGKQAEEELIITLKKTYESFAGATATAIETGNTTALLDSITTDIQVQHIIETAAKSKEKMWWRMDEVISIELRDHSEPYAETIIACLKGNERIYQIVYFERISGNWKVSGIDLNVSL